MGPSPLGVPVVPVARFGAVGLPPGWAGQSGPVRANLRRRYDWSVTGYVLQMFQHVLVQDRVTRMRCLRKLRDTLPGRIRRIRKGSLFWGFDVPVQSFTRQEEILALPDPSAAATDLLPECPGPDDRMAPRATFHELAGMKQKRFNTRTPRGVYE